MLFLVPYVLPFTVSDIEAGQVRVILVHYECATPMATGFVILMLRRVTVP